MKLNFILNSEEARNAIEYAYSAGYKQGSLDGREGIMINPKTVSEMFLRSLETVSEDTSFENIA